MGFFKEKLEILTEGTRFFSEIVKGGNFALDLVQNDGVSQKRLFPPESRFLPENEFFFKLAKIRNLQKDGVCISKKRF